MSSKKYGYNKHRLRIDDPYYAKEIAFAEQVNEEFKYGNYDFINRIVNKKNELGKFQYLTEEEEKVALSVLQWLGTPVGGNFLEKVNKRIKENEQ